MRAHAHRGEAWHRLRREDFSQVELDASAELWELLKSMMRAAPALRIGIALVDTHPVVVRARRAIMGTSIKMLACICC